jgi:Tfp pilus assembly protein PilP
MRGLRTLFGAALFLAPIVSAQEPPVPATAEPETLEAQPDTLEAQADDVIREILEPGQYQYQPLGRRDPFVSLLANVSPDGGPTLRPPGMPGFLLSEVTLKGIVDNQGEFVALLEATDGNSYFARIGQEFFDGSLVALDQAAATFRQQVRDPLSPVRTRDVTKSLYPSEEAR